MRNAVRILSLSILVALTGVAIAKTKPAATPASTADATPGASGTTPGSVYKDSVAVHQQASTTSATVTSLNKGTAVVVQKQDGLWFDVKAQPSTEGYVKINEIRLAQATGGSNDGYSMFGGHPKPGETAGVRGLSNEDLKGATFDGAAVARMETFRVDEAAAQAYASRMNLQKTEVAYKKEPGLGEGHRAADAGQSAQASSSRKAVFGMLGSHLGLGASTDAAAAAMPKSEQEKVDDEIAMGPQIAGRVLSVMPIWDNPQAQRRVNTIGHWVAMQTPRDDLPWTFAVVDNPTMNAFAAPGGYIIVTRGLYEVLQSDDEVAAVLGHEISHVVARDHYYVIMKQAATSAVTGFAIDKATAHAGVAGKFADYFAKQGASVLLTQFDKDVEFRSDGASLIYTARAGYNPLAMYAVLQKLDAVSDSGRTSNLYSTHPTASARLDRLDDKGLSSVSQFTDRPYVAAVR